MNKQVPANVIPEEDLCPARKPWEAPQIEILPIDSTNNTGPFGSDASIGDTSS
jgi:hypothetical protein